MFCKSAKLVVHGRDWQRKVPDEPFSDFDIVSRCETNTPSDTQDRLACGQGLFLPAQHRESYGFVTERFDIAFWTNSQCSIGGFNRFERSIEKREPSALKIPLHIIIGIKGNYFFDLLQRLRKRQSLRRRK